MRGRSELLKSFYIPPHSLRSDTVQSFSHRSSSTLRDLCEIPNKDSTLTESLSAPFFVQTWWQLVSNDIHSSGRDGPLTAAAAAATSSLILTRIHPRSHTHASTNTHTHTHLCYVKVWKRLCVITEQPKAPRGINNRPNAETTNTISRLHREVGGPHCWIWTYD